MRNWTGWVDRQCWVVPSARIVYVPTPKGGCTAVLWALAALEGSPETLAPRSLSAQHTRDLTIHDKRVHRLRRLERLSAAERAAALSSPEWVRFCVGRDPYDRLVSGWTDRVLLGREVVSDEEVSDDAGVMFRDFVRRLVSGTSDWADDVHFAPQTAVVQARAFPYSDIVRLPELPEFLATLAASDPARAGLRLERHNAGGLALATDTMFDAATAALVDEHFADDFATFGFPHRSFSEDAPPRPLGADALALIGQLRARDRRIDDLAKAARALASMPGTHRPSGWRARVRGLIRRRFGTPGGSETVDARP